MQLSIAFSIPLNHDFRRTAGMIAPDKTNVLSTHVCDRTEARWAAMIAYRAREMGCAKQLIAYVSGPDDVARDILAEFYNEVVEVESEQCIVQDLAGRDYSNLSALVKPRSVLLRDPTDLFRHTPGNGAIARLLAQDPVDLFDLYGGHGKVFAANSIADFDTSIVTVKPCPTFGGGGLPELFNETKPWCNIKERFYSRDYPKTGLGTVFLEVPARDDGGSASKVTRYHMERFLDTYPALSKFL